MGTKFDLDDLLAARGLIASKRIDVRERMKALETEDADLASEERDFETTIRMLGRFTPVQEEDEGDEDGGLPRGTARKHIETALNTFAREGKTAGEIREYIANRFKIEIPANTLSVTLSRLQSSGAAKLDGRKWQSSTPPVRPRLRDGWDTPDPDSGGSDLDDEIPF